MMVVSFICHLHALSKSCLQSSLKAFIMIVISGTFQDMGCHKIATLMTSWISMTNRI